MRKHFYFTLIYFLFLSQVALSRAISQDESRRPYFNLSLRRSFVEQSHSEKDRMLGMQFSFHVPAPVISFMDLGLSFSYLFDNYERHKDYSIQVDYLDLMMPFTFSYSYLFRYHISLEPGLTIERSRYNVLDKNETNIIPYMSFKSTFGLDYALTDRWELTLAGDLIYRSWHSQVDFSYLLGAQFRI